MRHREGSGIVTLRGLTNQCRARFKVSYYGNIEIPADGTAAEISMALAISGEPVQATLMRATPGAVSRFSNVSASTYIDVPRGCCVNIAVENTSDQPINVVNSNLIIEREA